MTFTTLISVADLAANIADPTWVVLDARFSLDDEGWGKVAYAQGHLPGAIQADLADDLAGPIIPGVTGRRPFPDPAVFAERLATWGIDASTQVVAYDAENGLMAAARVWFMLRWMGHDNVAVLDGGVKAWEAAGLALTTDVPTPTRADFVAHVRDDMLATVDEVDAIRRDQDFCVFDSRSAEGYHGGGKYHDPVVGHIAGAGLADRADVSSPEGFFRPTSELRAHYAALIDDTPAENVIFYCGSGVTAAQNVLAMTHAGLPGSRMYVGSWSEWILDPSREIEL